MLEYDGSLAREKVSRVQTNKDIYLALKATKNENIR